MIGTVVAPAGKKSPSARPQRPYQDSLRLLDTHRPSAPALAHRPLADGALEADDVPRRGNRRDRAKIFLINQYLFEDPEAVVPTFRYRGVRTIG
jgi:hypothetical protein